MQLKRVHVKNFRALEDADVEIDKLVTLVVGRNNSGKTSLLDLFSKFFGPEHFVFEDFSITQTRRITEAFERYRDACQEEERGDAASAERLVTSALKMLPTIRLLMTIEYKEEDDLSALSEVIIDLDSDRRDAQVLAEVQFETPLEAFSTWVAADAVNRTTVYEFLRRNFRQFFKVHYQAVDPGDAMNTKQVDRAAVERIFSARFVYAQNKLDDSSADKTGNLSKTFDNYYKRNGKQAASAVEIDNVLAKVSDELNGKYADLFKPIFTDLNTFGIETIEAQQLTIRALLETQDILTGESTKLFYRSGDDSTLLPEGHNGLGYTKLIFTILQTVGFYEEFKNSTPQPAVEVLFIEEPEAHLHPQMQEVFMKNIQEFVRRKAGWNVQLVITTHSSHVLASSGFEGIRYFDSQASGGVAVKDLSKFKATIDANADETMRFLRNYMVLHRCDLFFADKVILVEGAVERLLLPGMIERCAPDLKREYVSTVEVGGAYARRFKELVAFIGVPTLVITDIDAIDPTDRRKSCKTSTDAAETSNITLADWIPGIKPIAVLIACADEKKIKDGVRVAYQVPENAGDACGRSFEEAFILANAKRICDSASALSYGQLFTGDDGAVLTPDVVISTAYEIAGAITKKTNFAFDILAVPDWETPRYIREGLEWLSQTFS